MQDVFCSSDAYHEAKVREFLEYGEKPAPYYTLVMSDRTETNDGPTDPPIGLRLRIPPFRGWPEELR